MPLPTTLAGTTVKLTDSAGIERNAPLLFVSPTQINYQIPPGLLTGAVSVLITTGNGTLFTGVIIIANVAPGLFAAGLKPDAAEPGAAAA